MGMMATVPVPKFGRLTHAEYSCGKILLYTSTNLVLIAFHLRDMTTMIFQKKKM